MYHFRVSKIHFFCKFKVKNSFDISKPGQEVATLDEILNEAKGKIGVFVELKGETADTKMVDDVVKIIKEYHSFFWEYNNPYDKMPEPIIIFDEAQQKSNTSQTFQGKT